MMVENDRNMQLYLKKERWLCSRDSNKIFFFENLVRKGVTVQSTSVCILATASDKEFFHGK